MDNNNLFVYGILKRDFPLDLRNSPYKCKFVGEAVISEARLHRIGVGVGLRLEGTPLEVAHGEVFEIGQMWIWKYLDDIEKNGVNYTRRIVRAAVEDERDGLKEMDVWVYEHVYFSEEGYERLPVIESGDFQLQGGN